PIVLGVRLSSIRAPRHPRSPLFPYTTLFRSLQSPAAYAHEQLVGLQAVFHAEGLRRADDGRQTRSRGEAAVRRLYLLLAAQRYLQQIEIVQGLGLDAHLRPIAQASVGHVLALAQEQARIQAAAAIGQRQSVRAEHLGDMLLNALHILRMQLGIAFQ